MTLTSAIEAARGALKNLINEAEFDQHSYDDGQDRGCFGISEDTRKLIAAGSKALAALLGDNETGDEE